MPTTPKEPIIHKSKHLMAQFKGIVRKISNLNPTKPVSNFTTTKMKLSYHH